MSRSKTTVAIVISEVLEVDGQDIMQKVIAQDTIEFTSIRSFLKFFMILWQKAVKENFKFL